MQDSNYQRHFKALGKLARNYDVAGGQEETLELLQARTMDQVATGEADSLPATTLLARNMDAWTRARANGPAAIRALMQNIARKYLMDRDFTKDLTTTPQGNTPAHVLAALQTEMGAGVDSKTLTTLSSAGLVNFLNSLLSAPGTWNTAADEDANYRDSVYVVDALV